MSSKQDRAYVRTAAALEQKYRGRLGVPGLEAEAITQINETLTKIAKGEIAVSTKVSQEKTVDITKNGTTEVIPDENKVLSKVKVNVSVSGGGSATIDENGIVTFGNNTSVNENGVVNL